MPSYWAAQWIKQPQCISGGGTHESTICSGNGSDAIRGGTRDGGGWLMDRLYFGQPVWSKGRERRSRRVHHQVRQGARRQVRVRERRGQEGVRSRRAGQSGGACRTPRDRKGQRGRRNAEADQRRHGTGSQVISQEILHVGRPDSLGAHVLFW